MAGHSHEFGRSGPRDEPQTETDAVHALFNFGFPPKGRSADDKEAHQNWIEETDAAVKRAYEVLTLTERFSLSAATRQPDA